eukprot:scaffold36082_cov51-Phaeocystis_antarctica.AAC.2
MEASPPLSGSASSLICDASNGALVGMTLTRICRIEPDCASYIGETRTSTRSTAPERHGMSRYDDASARPCTPHRSTSSNCGGSGWPVASSDVRGSACSCAGLQPTLAASAPFAANMFPSVPTTQHAPSHAATYDCQSSPAAAFCICSLLTEPGDHQDLS